MSKIFLNNRFFYLAGLIIVLFLVSYGIPSMYLVAKVALGLLALVSVMDFIILFRVRTKISATRSIAEKVSLGDEQCIHYAITNDSNLDIHVELIDELPKQLQLRNTRINKKVDKNQKVEHAFIIKPTERGLYNFGDINLYLSTGVFSLIDLKSVISISESVKVMPSIIQMKKYELMVFSNTANRNGIRKVRQVGENDEFERIRTFQQGDNIKAINWKATSRLNKIMLNQYQNTKSQNVYCVIDKGRSMKMPFDDLSLLDYAINSALVISNIVLRKYDRVGLITFSNKIGALVKSDSRKGQLETIMDSLYKQKTEFKESSFELINIIVRKKITGRSLVILFTNFETRQDFLRNLPYLKAMNKIHLLLIVIFINTELEEASERVSKTEDEIYFQTFARRMSIEKEFIRMELNSNGIQAILTKPQDLSINVINKYLEFKAKRML